MVTSEKPSFDAEENAAGTSKMTTGLVTQPSVLPTTSISPVQATSEAASFTATQPVEVPGAKVATQPVKTPGARPVVHPKANGSAEELQTSRPVE